MGKTEKVIVVTKDNGKVQERTHFKKRVDIVDVENKKTDCSANNKLKIKKKHFIVFICICFWEWLKRLFIRVSIYHRKGAHIITGYPGCGKTLLAEKIINEVDASKYFFITNIDEFYNENVYHYNVFGLFYETKQIKKLPIRDEKGRKLYGLILDEINLKYNRRLNRSKDYNNSFVGLIELLVTHRHQKIPRVYFIGQKLELQDGQLQSLFKYWHNIIYNKLRPSWKFYKNGKGYVIVPKKLFIENFIKSYQDEYLQDENISIVKISYEDLTGYNTYGLAETYEQLPTLKRETKTI